MSSLDSDKYVLNAEALEAAGRGGARVVMRTGISGVDHQRLIDAELVDAIDDVLMEKTRDEWGEIFDVAGIIWGPVLSLDEVAVDPQAAAIDMFPEIEHSSLGRYASVRIPMRFRAADVAPRGPAPKLGEHTSAILRDCGMNDEEIQKLLDQDAIR